MNTKFSPIIWTAVPTQLVPFDELRADWHYTLSDGIEFSAGVIENETISAAFWKMANTIKVHQGVWIGSLRQVGGGQMWAGHMPRY